LRDDARDAGVLLRLRGRGDRARRGGPVLERELPGVVPGAVVLQGLRPDERLGHGDRVRLALRVGLHARLLAAGVGGRVAGGELRGLERAEACVALVGLVDLRGDVVGASQQLVDVAVVVGVGQQSGDLVALLGQGRCATRDGVDRVPLARVLAVGGAALAVAECSACAHWPVLSVRGRLAAAQMSGCLRPSFTAGGSRPATARGLYVRCERPGCGEGRSISWGRVGGGCNSRPGVGVYLRRRPPLTRRGSERYEDFFAQRRANGWRVAKAQLSPLCLATELGHSDHHLRSGRPLRRPTIRVSPRSGGPCCRPGTGRPGRAWCRGSDPRLRPSAPCRASTSHRTWRASLATEVRLPHICGTGADPLWRACKYD